MLSYLQNQIAGSFFFAKVKDETRLAVEPERYRNDVSLKGEFIRQVLASELSEHEKAAVIRAGFSTGSARRGAFLRSSRTAMHGRTCPKIPG